MPSVTDIFIRFHLSECDFCHVFIYDIDLPFMHGAEAFFLVFGKSLLLRHSHEKHAEVNPLLDFPWLEEFATVFRDNDGFELMGSIAWK